MEMPKGISGVTAGVTGRREKSCRWKEITIPSSRLRKVMSLQSNRSRLAGLSKELNRSWQETQDFWRDQKRKEFDESYMRPLMDSIENAVAAMDDLDKILKRIRRDCDTD